MQKNTERSAMEELAHLIAMLLAKRWYRMQADQQAAPQESKRTKKRSCPKDTAALDADASPQPKPTSVKKPRKKK